MATDNSARAAAHLAGYNLPQFSNAVEAIDNESTRSLAADLVNATVTPADVPGFSFALEAGRSYTLKLDGTYTVASAANGLRFLPVFSGTATRVVYTVQAITTVGATAVLASNTGTSGQVGAATGAAAVAEAPISLSLSIQGVTVGGTLQLQIASSAAANATLKAGSSAVLSST